MTEADNGKTEPAHKVCKRVASEVRELLERHSEFLGPELVRTISHREGIRAGNEYIHKLIEGRGNDNASKNPGVTIYLTDLGKIHLSGLLSREDYQISQDDLEDAGEHLTALRLPKGAYQAGGLGLRFQIEASDNWHDIATAPYPFKLQYEHVVRIEGDSGELWQNDYYSVDGSPKFS